MFAQEMGIHMAVDYVRIIQPGHTLTFGSKTSVIKWIGLKGRSHCKSGMHGLGARRRPARGIGGVLFVVSCIK